MGDHQPRLVEAADQVLAVACVDPGLAADGAVHLRKKRRWDLCKADTAQKNRCGKSGEVADHPAAERQQHRTAFDALIEECFEEPLQMGKILGPLARRQHHQLRRNSLTFESAAEGEKVQLGHALIGDDKHALFLEHRSNEPARLTQQALADKDLVAALTQSDFDPLDQAADPCGSASSAKRSCKAAMTRSTGASGGGSSPST